MSECSSGNDQQLRGWTVADEAAVLSAINHFNEQATTGKIAGYIGRNKPDTGRFLAELSGRGVVRFTLCKNRPYWQKNVIEVDPNLVKVEHEGQIMEYLVGRRELASAIARALHLPRAEVLETCKSLMLRGQLTGTPVGNAVVYALEVRGTTAQLERPAPVSPQAQFQMALCRRPAAVPQPTRSPAAKHQAVPPVPDTPAKRKLTPALEAQLWQELPPHERRKPGKTAAVAARYGLTIAQVRRALTRIPVL